MNEHLKWNCGTIYWDDPFKAIKELCDSYDWWKNRHPEVDTRFLTETFDAIQAIVETEIDAQKAADDGL